MTQLQIIGCRCRDWRKEHGVSAMKIASICKYSVWQVYKFENGALNNMHVYLAYLKAGMEPIKEGDIT